MKNLVKIALALSVLSGPAAFAMYPSDPTPPNDQCIKKSVDRKTTPGFTHGTLCR